MLKPEIFLHIADEERDFPTSKYRKEKKMTETTETMEKKVKMLPVLNFNKQYMNNTKIGRSIMNKDFNLEEYMKNHITVEVSDNAINLVDIWKDENISLSTYNINLFDMAVMDAAYTIMVSGYEVITPEWIGKVLSGNTDQRITAQRKEKIQKSIDKLRSIHIRINCEKEIKTRKDTKNKIKKFVYESYLLPLGKAEIKYQANGKEVTAYTVLEKPALYWYAENLHQIVDVPASLLETQEEFHDTDEAILIKRYVIKRVAQILTGSGMYSNKISFLWEDKNGEKKGLFTELGCIPDDSKAWRDQKQKINRIVKLTLQSLKDRNIILDYEAYREQGSTNPSKPILGYQIQAKKTRKIEISE